MVSKGFTKAQRLLKPSDFQHVFDAVELKQGGQHFTFLARTSSEGLVSRLGIIVSRKTSPKAVERNRIKRIVRESFRHHILGPENALPPHDTIVMAKPSSARLNNASLTSSLHLQWSKLCAKAKSARQTIQ